VIFFGFFDKYSDHGDRYSSTLGAFLAKDQIKAYPHMYSNETRFVRQTDVLVSKVGDGMILLDPVKGEFLTFNPVASKIYELLESQMEFEKLCAVLTDEFDVDPDVCRQELSVHLSDLVSRKLVLVV